MPSSTSSFERSVPRGRWRRALLLGVVLAVAALSGWEIRVRTLGYGPTLDDTGDLWAANLTALEHSGPDRVVAIGSSRIQFDLDLDAYAAYFNLEKPIQLAIPGSKPLAVLEHLAADEHFRGTVLVGVTPGLYFAPQGMPVNHTDEALRRYENWSPSQRAGHLVSKALQRRLAFINQDDLTLADLLARASLANRPGTRGNVAPQLPPYFARVADDRRARMWEKCDFGSPLAHKIQQIWIPLFTPPPPPPDIPAEEFRAMFMESVEKDLRRTRESVAAIRSRGGRVVFLRFPSTGGCRELENQFSPREGFWERLIAAADAPGIHFEDHEALRGFDCPEWSHLTEADAAVYSRNLMPILARALEAE